MIPSPIVTPGAGSAASTATPHAASSERRACAPITIRSAAGPTMSPSTAPASIEASWAGSPTSTSRACGLSASSSLAISDSDTIDVSSTITTSWGSR